MINDSLQKLFNRGRHRLLSRSSSGRYFSDPTIAGIIVEFIGPSGIGKTTILKSAKPFLKFPWNYALPPANAQDSRDDAKNRKLQVFARQLLESKLNKIVESRSFFTIADIASFYAMFLAREVGLLQSADRQSGGIFLHEGVSHLFLQEILELFEMREDFGALVREITPRRAYIDVRAPSEVIEKRVGEKALSRPTAREFYNSYDGGSLGEKIAHYQSSKDRLLLHYSKIGFPVFCLDTEQSIVGQLLGIEAQIAQNYWSDR